MVSKSDKNLIKKSVDISVQAGASAIDTALKTTPGLSIAYSLAKALYGNAMEMRKQRVFEFVEPIVDNPGIFSSKILASEEFQDGFVTMLQVYITLRSEEKRKIVRNVFIDFARSLNKMDFQIERYTDTVQKISPASIALLGFINQEILPYREAEIIEKLHSDNLGDEKPFEWWLALRLKQESVSDYFERWIFHRYNPGGTDMKEKHGNGEQKVIPDKKQFELLDIEAAKREELYKPLSELIYLGLISTGVSPGGIGVVSGMTWTLTDFAHEFIKYLDRKSDAAQLPAHE
jgi:hypothetical protein